jgi:hypothetical protein
MGEAVLIGITAALGFVALGLGLLVLSAPATLTPVDITGPGLSNSLPLRRQHPIQGRTPEESRSSPGYGGGSMMASNAKQPRAQRRLRSILR